MIPGIPSLIYIDQTCANYQGEVTSVQQAIERAYKAYYETGGIAIEEKYEMRILLL